MGCHPGWGGISGSEERGPGGLSCGHHWGVAGADRGPQPRSRLLPKPWTLSSCCWNCPGEGRPGKALSSQEPSAGVTSSQEGEAAGRAHRIPSEPCHQRPRVSAPGSWGCSVEAVAWGAPVVSLLSSWLRAPRWVPVCIHLPGRRTLGPPTIARQVGVPSEAASWPRWAEASWSRCRMFSRQRTQGSPRAVGRSAPRQGP